MPISVSGTNTATPNVIYMDPKGHAYESTQPNAKKPKLPFTAHDLQAQKAQLKKTDTLELSTMQKISKNTQGAINWAKAHPCKTAGIAALGLLGMTALNNLFSGGKEKVE